MHKSCLVMLITLLLFGHSVNAETLLIDMAHGQHFSTEKDGPLDLSNLAAVFRAAGREPAISHAAWSDATLAGATAMVVSGPFSPPSAEETAALVRFVERGGKVAVMLHIAPPMGGLIHRLGGMVSNGVIREQGDLIAGEALNFRVTTLADHPLLAGVENFSVYGGWAVAADGGGRVVAATSPHAWIDLDGDRKRSDRDAMQSFGVMLAGRQGRGEFVIFGDDGIFQNKFLEGGNLLLARNLAEWLQ